MLSKKQQKEIECLDYFALKNCDYSKVVGNITPGINIKEGETSPEEAYFQITDSGKKEVKTNNKPRLLQLLDNQKWRLRQIDTYEQGVLEGSTPYYTILGFEEEPVPETVMEFMARTMFKGLDKDLIRGFYKENLCLY